MKIVIGLFSPENVMAAVHYLTENGFTHDDLSLLSTAAAVPDYLEEEEPEEAAAAGAIAGATLGGTVGAAGGMALASMIPGFESLVVSALMSTAVGSVIGGYLGSLYSVRADDKTRIDVEDALAGGQVLLVVKTDELRAETAVSLMNETQGEHVEVHDVPGDKVMAAEQPAKRSQESGDGGSQRWLSK